MKTHSSWTEIKRGFHRDFKYGPKDKRRRAVLRHRIDRRYKWRKRIWSWTRIDIDWMFRDRS